MLGTPKPREQKGSYNAEQAVSSTVISSCKEEKRSYPESQRARKPQ